MLKQKKVNNKSMTMNYTDFSCAAYSVMSDSSLKVQVILITLIDM